MNRFKSTIKKIFFIVSAISLPLINYAQNDTISHERFYQVEILIFSRAETSKEEKWPTNIKLAYPASALPLRTSGEGESAITLLTPSLLTSQAASLAKNPAYSILFHQAWREKITARRTHLVISGGKIFNGHQELEGTIALNVGQYLMLQTNLWLTRFAPVGTSVTSASIASSSITETWPELPSFNNSNSSNSNSTNSNNPKDAVITRIVKINEQRSMRSNEVHYIDHPLFGLFIKIIPVN